MSHDAVIAIFKGAVEIIHAENTISGASLSEAIRTVSKYNNYHIYVFYNTFSDFFALCGVR